MSGGRVGGWYDVERDDGRRREVPCPPCAVTTEVRESPDANYHRAFRDVSTGIVQWVNGNQSTRYEGACKMRGMPKSPERREKDDVVCLETPESSVIPSQTVLSRRLDQIVFHQHIVRPISPRPDSLKLYLCGLPSNTKSGLRSTIVCPFLITVTLIPCPACMACAKRFIPAAPANVRQLPPEQSWTFAGPVRCTWA